MTGRAFDPGRRSGLLGTAAAAGAAKPAAGAHDTGAVDLTDVQILLRSFVKSVGDLSGEQVTLWAHGAIYAWTPDYGGVHLFDEDLFAVRRFKPIKNGWLRLHKEAGIYLHKDTGEVLDRWYNPFIEREVDVVHLRNDPVNREHVPKQQGGFWSTNYWEQSGTVCFYRNVLLGREAEMSVEEYPLHSQSNLYKFAELYNFFVDRRHLEDPEVTSAPMVGCNTRIGHWLPWMEMGSRRGWLLIQLRFKKLDHVEQQPTQTLTWFEKNAPDMLVAPTEITGPNETSWTYYKKLIDEKRTAGKGD